MRTERRWQATVGTSKPKPPSLHETRGDSECRTSLTCGNSLGGSGIWADETGLDARDLRNTRPSIKWPTLGVAGIRLRAVSAEAGAAFVAEAIR